MGCDIHFVVEARQEGGTEWVGVYSTCATPRLKPESEHRQKGDEEVWMRSIRRAPVFQGRSYSFFANLAGVRGNGPDAKGVPEDASLLTRMMVNGWEGDGHSHSYDTLFDFALAYLKTREDEYQAHTAEILAKGCDPSETQVMEDLMGNDRDGWEYRVIYWFDN